MTVKSPAGFLTVRCYTLGTAERALHAWQPLADGGGLVTVDATILWANGAYDQFSFALRKGVGIDMGTTIQQKKRLRKWGLGVKR